MQTLIQAPAFVCCELHFQNPHMHIINTVDYVPFIQSSLALRNQLKAVCGANVVT